MDKDKKTGYKTVLKQKQYMKLMAADVVNRFGDALDALAFQWLIFTLTGSAAWSAIVVGLNWLPTILLQPVFGALAERLDKKRIMVVSDILRGCIVLCFAAVYLCGALKPWHMLGFTLMLSSVEAMRVPTGMAFVPQVVDMKCYSYASALNRTACAVMELVGAGAAGVLIAACGVWTVMLIDAATFFISALFILWIHPKGEQCQAKRRVRTGAVLLKNLKTDLKTGFAYMKRKRYIFHLCMMGMLLNAIFSPLNSLMSPLIIGILGCDSKMLGFVGIAMSFGGIAGGILYPWAGKNIGTRQSILLGGAVLSAGYGGFVFSPLMADRPVGLYMLLFISGVFLSGGITFIVSSVAVSMTVNTDEAYRARIGGIFNSMATLAIPASSVIVSGLSMVFSVPFILTLSVILCMIIFVIIAVKRISFEEETDGGDGRQRGEPDCGIRLDRPD